VVPGSPPSSNEAVVVETTAGEVDVVTAEFVVTGAGVSSPDLGDGFRDADAATDEWSITVAVGAMP
jgi:L-2-hydroxyglutarate oxidase LhgO